MLPRQTRYGYSALPQRPGWTWPGGSKLAVYVALGVEEYIFGEGMTEDLFPGAPKPDYANTSWRDYGNRVGGFRVMDACAAAGLTPALLLNTELYDHAPAVTDHARALGCEVVAHGLTNSHTLAGRDPQDEAAYLAAAAAAIARAEGQAPAGWSSPWLAHTDHTADLLVETGYRYVLDLGMDDQPVWLSTRSGPLLCVPYGLELNDSTTIIGRQADARDFAQMIIDQFDELLHQATVGDQALVMPIVLHSFISGQPFRLRALRAALDHIAAVGDRIWRTSPGAIAQHIFDQPSRAV